MLQRSAGKPLRHSIAQQQRSHRQSDRGRSAITGRPYFLPYRHKTLSRRTPRKRPAVAHTASGCRRPIAAAPARERRKNPRPAQAAGHPNVDSRDDIQRICSGRPCTWSSCGHAREAAALSTVHRRAHPPRQPSRSTSRQPVKIERRRNPRTTPLLTANHERVHARAPPWPKHARKTRPRLKARQPERKRLGAKRPGIRRRTGKGGNDNPPLKAHGKTNSRITAPIYARSDPS